MRPLIDEDTPWPQTLEMSKETEKSGHEPREGFETKKD
jgi:hypothetical protein